MRQWINAVSNCICHVEFILPLVDTALCAGRPVSRRGTKRRCISGSVVNGDIGCRGCANSSRALQRSFPWGSREREKSWAARSVAVSSLGRECLVPCTRGTTQRYVVVCARARLIYSIFLWSLTMTASVEDYYDGSRTFSWLTGVIHVPIDQVRILSSVSLS